MLPCGGCFGVDGECSAQPHQLANPAKCRAFQDGFCTFHGLTTLVRHAAATPVDSVYEGRSVFIMSTPFNSQRLTHRVRVAKKRIGVFAGIGLLDDGALQYCRPIHTKASEAPANSASSWPMAYVLLLASNLAEAEAVRHVLGCSTMGQAGLELSVDFTGTPSKATVAPPQAAPQPAPQMPPQTPSVSGATAAAPSTPQANVQLTTDEFMSWLAPTPQSASSSGSTPSNSSSTPTGQHSQHQPQPDI